jgi:hypothetical protein
MLGRAAARGRRNRTATAMVASGCRCCKLSIPELQSIGVAASRPVSSCCKPEVVAVATRNSSMLPRRDGGAAWARRRCFQYGGAMLQRHSVPARRLEQASPWMLAAYTTGAAKGSHGCYHHLPSELPRPTSELQAPLLRTSTGGATRGRCGCCKHLQPEIQRRTRKLHSAYV